jgi:hypothetical protein
MYTNYQNLLPARGFVGIVLAPKLWNCRIKRAIEVISADTKQREEIPYTVEKVYNSTIIAVGRHLSHTKIEMRFPRIDPFSHGTISMTDSIEWGVDIGKSTGTGKIDRPHYEERLRTGTFIRRIKGACNFAYPKSGSQVLPKEHLLMRKGQFAAYQHLYAVYRAPSCVFQRAQN